VSCQAISAVSLLSSNTVLLKLVQPAAADASPSGEGAAQAYVVDAPDDEPEPDPSAATAPIERPAIAAGVPQPPGRQPGRRLGAVALLACGGLAAVLAFGAMMLRDRSGRGPTDRGDAGAIGPATSATGKATVPETSEQRVAINIAYGTEKQQWFEAAAAEFQRSEAGRGISIVLHGMGSMEGARAVLEGPEPIPMHVWSPASSAYRDTFEREWRAKHTRAPIVKAENLVLTPLVFVMWEGRHEAFLKKYAKVGFRTVAEAIRETGGWGSIAGHPEWGRFKFGHTHPEHSNSGLLTLVLMAYGFFGKDYDLSRDEIARPEFQEWLRRFERGVVRPGGTLTHSTGSLMREMVQRGPSQYDAVFVYENLAIGYLDAARDRWGQLVVDYPEPNMWNEHPYYILDVPWSDARQREAAGAFLKFLMSEPIQRRALEHGFRPGNTSVSVRNPDSPLVRHANRGLQIELPRMGDPPTNEVVRELLAASRRVEQPAGK
jgi:Ca-activated chloride channel family protein